MNGELICLSSDDEEPSPKKFKFDSIQQNHKEENKKKEKLTDSVICLDSDEDNNSEDLIIVNKENLDTNGSTESHQNNSADAVNPIEVVSCSRSFTLDSSSELSDINKDTDESENEQSSESSDTEYYAEEEILPSKQQTDKPEVQSDTSTSKYSDLLEDTEDLPEEALKFLKTCKKVLIKSNAETIFKKFPVIIKMFRSLSEEISKAEYLKKFLKKQTNIAKQSVKCSIISFSDVYQHLKESLDSQSIELPKKHWKHVRKLEKLMEKIVKKLKDLEESEVNFEEDDEENSAYIKHDRYTERLNKVYKKYCEILKKNPYAGRITYERLDFVSSNHNEINQAISKKYKNNLKFPNYNELHDFIRTVVEEKNLPLNDAELKIESELCFKKLGDLLQTRRKKELYESHQRYLSAEDPARNDEELEKRLRISSKEGKVRIEQICQEFVKRQELGLVGEEVDISQSENEDDENEGIEI